MKNHIIISLLFLSVGLSQQEYHSNDLVEMDNGLWTVKFSNEPISGKIYSGFGKVGNLKKVYVGNIVNGKKEGKWVYWYHSTGKKRFEENWKDNKMDGLLIQWYEENGQKHFEGIFKNGKQDGLWTEWYENGQKKNEFLFRDGKNDGLSVGWYDNGNKMVKGTFKDGNLISEKYWDEDGSVRKEPFPWD